MDQPGKVVNPARGQLNRENEYSPAPVRALSSGVGSSGLVRPGPFVSSFESVEAVTQVLVRVASPLEAPWVGVVSILGVLENGEAFSVSPYELPPAL